jgi:dihydroorotate dehydrogenase
MKWLYQTLIRPVLFQMEAEQAHERALNLLTTAGKSPSLSFLLQSFCGSPLLPTTIKHLSFPNPLGLAAGMDKNAIALPVWDHLGFGFCEIGGITGQEQPGNAKPRMFRSPTDQAIINRMGFNNDGLEKVANRLAGWRASGQWPFNTRRY